MKSDQDIFKHYLNVAKVIGETFAPLAEVIVHDLRKPHASIIAIYNGHITGRKVGDGTSDLGLKRLNEDVPDEIINYKNTAPNGGQLKSSTLAIRDQNNHIIGSFSINIKLSYFDSILELINPLMSMKNIDSISQSGENFLMPHKENHLPSQIMTICKQHHLDRQRLSKKDKMVIITQLDGQGAFEKRGAVPKVAHLLTISIPTVYKYLKQGRMQ